MKIVKVEAEAHKVRYTELAKRLNSRYQDVFIFQ